MGSLTKDVWAESRPRIGSMTKGFSSIFISVYESLSNAFLVRLDGRGRGRGLGLGRRRAQLNCDGYNKSVAGCSDPVRETTMGQGV